MVFDEFPLMLPFYDDKSKQNRFKENIPNDQVYDLWALNDRAIPFQFRTELGATLSSIQIFSEDDVLLFTVKKEMISSEAVSGYQYFTWFAAEPFKLTNDALLDIPCIKFYFKVNFSGVLIVPLYSEVMSVIEDESRYFVMEWSNNVGDIDPVYYGNGFINRMYSDTFVTKGIPTVELDTEKDGFGNTVVLSRRMINNYDFSLLVAPNFIIDAINFMSLHDDITISTKQGVRSGKIENVTIDQDQIDLYAYWGLTVKFNQPTFYFAGSCPTPITPPAIPDEIIIDRGRPDQLFDLIYDAN